MAITVLLRARCEGFIVGSVTPLLTVVIFLDCAVLSAAFLSNSVLSH